MNLAPFVPLWLMGLLGLLLLVAAAEDLWRLRISNVVSGAVLLCGIAAVGFAGPTLAMWENAVVFAGVLAGGTFLFSKGKFGGGDVKLLAAVTLWFSLEGALRLLAAVFIAGGLLAIAYLSVGKAKRPRKGIPYGVAIASGASVALYSTVVG